MIQPLFYETICGINLWKYWRKRWGCNGDISIIHIKISKYQLYFVMLNIGFVFDWNQMIYNIRGR